MRLALPLTALAPQTAVRYVAPPWSDSPPRRA